MKWYEEVFKFKIPFYVTAMIIIIIVQSFIIREKNKDIAYLENDNLELMILNHIHEVKKQKLDSLLGSLEVEHYLFKGLQANLEKQNDFIQTHTPEEIMNYYSNNNENLGGGE